jgi:hypothetical protein
MIYCVIGELSVRIERAEVEEHYIPRSWVHCIGSESLCLRIGDFSRISGMGGVDRFAVIHAIPDLTALWVRKVGQCGGA